jgi:hypothetical protein
MLRSQFQMADNPTEARLQGSTLTSRPLDNQVANPPGLVTTTQSSPPQSLFT